MHYFSSPDLTLNYYCSNFVMCDSYAFVTRCFVSRMKIWLVIPENGRFIRECLIFDKLVNRIELKLTANINNYSLAGFSFASIVILEYSKSE